MHFKSQRSLLVGILMELVKIRELLEKQSTPDVRDQKCLDVDEVAERLYSSMLDKMKKSQNLQYENATKKHPVNRRQ